MSRIHDRGRLGEILAARHLERDGWEVLARNWRFGHREIDLIIRRGEVIAFVEVKTRSGPGSGSPFESITRRKRMEVEGAARGWIRELGFGQKGSSDRSTIESSRFRFDAVSVELRKGRPPQVVHLPDAWWIGDP